MASADSTTNGDQDSTFPSDGKMFDAFISYNSADEAFVHDLLRYLESPDIGLKCVDHRRDFHPGQTVVGNIDEFIENSSKYVLIMSPAFVDSEWCQWETDVMVSMSVEERRGIIPVLLEPCKIPTKLNSLTYIDVCQSETWRQRLVNYIKRTDLNGIEHKTRDTGEIIQRAAEKEADYKKCVQNYTQDREKFDLEKTVLESKVRIAYNAVRKQVTAALERQQKEKMDEIRRLLDTRHTPLVQKMKAAEDILKLMKDFKEEDHLVSKLDKLQDEYDLQEHNLKQLSHMEFVKCDSLVETLADQISKFDVGHLRETDTTMFSCPDDVDDSVEEMRPSFDTRTGTASHNRGNTQRPEIKYDEETMHGRRTILPDGSLLNREPSEPVTDPDKRLKKFLGAVGTTTLAAGGVYYWENKADVDLQKELSGRNFVIVVALSGSGVFDEAQSGELLPTALCVAVRACKTHQAVCLYVTKYTSLVYHEVLTQNRSGVWSSIELGFLLDTVRQRLTVYDVTKKGEITSVGVIGVVEEFTPQFGVFAGHAGSVKLSLITGRDTKLSPEMLKNIRKDNP